MKMNKKYNNNKNKIKTFYKISNKILKKINDYIYYSYIYKTIIKK